MKDPTLDYFLSLQLACICPFRGILATVPVIGVTGLI